MEPQVVFETVDDHIMSICAKIHDDIKRHEEESKQLKDEFDAKAELVKHLIEPIVTANCHRELDNYAAKEDNEVINTKKFEIRFSIEVPETDLRLPCSLEYVHCHLGVNYHYDKQELNDNVNELLLRASINKLMQNHKVFHRCRIEKIDKVIKHDVCYYVCSFSLVIQV